MGMVLDPLIGTRWGEVERIFGFTVVGAPEGRFLQRLSGCGGGWVLARVRERAINAFQRPVLAQQVDRFVDAR
jgi:hypothetical protein